MLILITVFLLTLAAAVLVAVRIIRPSFRYFWPIAVGGTLLAWISTWVWLVALPLSPQLPPWQPANLFAESPSFLADGISWPFALSLTGLALAYLLTEVARADVANPLPWAGVLTLTGLGVLAVTANSPLTLIAVWAALDLAELITLLRAVDNPSASERAVISFSTRVAGIGLVLWASISSTSSGSRLDFRSMPSSASIYLLIAAGLRLGVIPLHLPFSGESVLRRGVGTSMRLISAASSLILLARIPAESTASPLTPVLLVLTAFAALYAAWTWSRAPDDLAGRPFWGIGLSALAMASSLRGNPVGAAAWGCALILGGGALFLASVQQIWLNRALLLAVFGLSSLPFSLTASGWESSTPSFFLAWPLLLAAQALLVAGYVRHALRPGARENMEAQPSWTRNVYPAGIAILLLSILLLGLFGWDGAGRMGAWIAALFASILTVGLIWITPRLRLFNPIRAHWIRPSDNTWRSVLSRNLWNTYQSLSQLTTAISATLEGEGGIMWTLLFLALLISFLTRGAP